MPRVPLDLLSLLYAECAGFDAAVPVLGGRPEPVCAAYRRSAAAAVDAALASRRLKAADALRGLTIRWVGEEELALHGFTPEDFWNLNTPADYQALLTSRHTGAGVAGEPVLPARPPAEPPASRTEGSE
jgi:molybdopterin-guanine dinucleotide biosynthesis protein A